MNNQTHISIILDRTGSMANVRDDVIGGFNAFLAAQQVSEGDATLTLVQFDSQDPYEVICQSTAIANVPMLSENTYAPRASTPLYDALGRGILDLEHQLAKRNPTETPDKIVFVVITDGQENASREFDRNRVMALIDAKKSLGWQFVFLSADLEAFRDAERIGVKSESSLYFMKSSVGTRNAFDSMSQKINAFRDGTYQDVQFDEDDRRKQSPSE